MDACFCRDCGSLLLLPDSGDVKCGTCGLRSSYAALGSLERVTELPAREAPAWVKAAVGEGDQDNDNAEPIRATVDEPCPKCNHPQLNFYTMQMRSADEGQTVFYECTNCGHKFSQNN